MTLVRVRQNIPSVLCEAFDLPVPLYKNHSKIETFLGAVNVKKEKMPHWSQLLGGNFSQRCTQRTINNGALVVRVVLFCSRRTEHCRMPLLALFHGWSCFFFCFPFTSIETVSLHRLFNRATFPHIMVMHYAHCERLKKDRVSSCLRIWKDQDKLTRMIEKWISWCAGVCYRFLCSNVKGCNVSNGGKIQLNFTRKNDVIMHSLDWKTALYRLVMFATRE